MNQCLYCILPTKPGFTTSVLVCHAAGEVVVKASAPGQYAVVKASAPPRL